VAAVLASGLALALSVIGVCGSAFARQPTPELPYDDHVPVRFEIQHFDVHGRTNGALEESLHYSGPIGFAADTQATLSTYLQFERAGERCRLTTIEIPVYIIIRYPHWVEFERANRLMRADWERRMAALEEHENGHATLAFSAAFELYETLTEFGQDADCETLNDDMQALTRSAVAASRRRNRDYDEITGHGVRQEEYDWTVVLADPAGG
jgi:predicted secreted Zn-dependent protease